jgi:hypothetical protein
MEIISILVFLAFILIVITLFGLGIWAAVRWLIREIAGKPAPQQPSQTLGLSQSASRCPNCNFTLTASAEFCGHCGIPRVSNIVSELLKDLAATVRQVERFRRSGVLDEAAYESLKHQLEVERLRLTHRGFSPTAAASAPIVSETTVIPPSVVDEPSLAHPTSQTSTSGPPASVTAISLDLIIEETPAPSHPWAEDNTDATSRFPGTGARTPRFESSEPVTPPPPPPPPPPRKPFTEVLAAFMEQSNIRWGEIIGGLLIIGCSTALVVSLWSQISSIPVLKFLIFTTVTAALFGVGMYTEHRWKLPTTSRGILTIATLLVPLNFLAIAAVSGGTIPPGALVIGSELIAPALFLCLVYFAGRVITPDWPHLLAAGVLGSSVGQLLIRHFAAADNSPGLLLALGAFPVVCYVAATAWMLWIALADNEIDESETNSILTTLGALTFAAVLPFGLLLYKSGPVSMSMMYLAPLVTLGGVPMLASGTLLWQRVKSKELIAYRTAGTSMAVAATGLVLAGMVLAWPNPASIVPAAIFSFAVFTALAVLLELPPAHLVAAGCLTLAYLVLFHVGADHIAWQNLRVTSLLDVMATVSTGQALAPMFVLFLGVTEWLTRKQRRLDSRYYLIAACGVAGVSLLFFAASGVAGSADPYGAWFIYLIYAMGAFWIAWRRQVVAFGWIGSALILLSLGQALGPGLALSFPWQTAMLVHASICAVAAIAFARHLRARHFLSQPLNGSALLTSALTIWLQLFNGPFETTGMLAQTFFWLAAIWFVSLWLNRARVLFTALQIAFAVALVLAVKATLQRYEWYSFLPHAFLHPTALQIQGMALVLLSLAWVSLRFGIGQLSLSTVSDEEKGNEDRAATEGEPPFPGSQRHDLRAAVTGRLPAVSESSWLVDARRLLDARFAFDRTVLWFVLGGLLVLAMYGALSGVRQELTTRGSATPVWNIAGFPHQDALAIGSWVVLGLLVIAMLANLYQRRRALYFFGAVAALTTVCPLLAGLWESQIATASAWRWLAAVSLAVGSVSLWCRDRVWRRLVSFGWPPTDRSLDELAHRTRVLLLALTVLPLLILTAYPALRTINYLPVHGPTSGIFYALNETLSYSIPLMVVVLVLIGYALRERLVSYAFSAGLFLNVTTSMAYLLAVVAVHGNMDRVVVIQVIQLNAITSAYYGILWLSVRPRWRELLNQRTAALAGKLFKVQIGIAIIGSAILLIPAAINLIVHPGWNGPGSAAVGGLYGWAAFVLATMAFAWFSRAYSKRLSPNSLCAMLVAASCLLAFNGNWSPANWSGYHALMITLALTAWLMLLARRLPSFIETTAGGSRFIKEQISAIGLTDEWKWNAALLATVSGSAAVLLALRGVSNDPTGSWWSLGVVLVMSTLAAALNWQTLRRGYLYAAGILFATATSIWWLNHWVAQDVDVTRFLEVNVTALCFSSVAWLAFEMRARRVLGSNRSTVASFHNVVALWSLVIMAALVFIRLTLEVFGVRVPHVELAWLSLSSLVVLMIACIWDSHAKYPVAGLYLTGLLVLGMAMNELRLTPTRMAWAVVIALAVYAIATSLIWRWRDQLIAWTARLRIPARLKPDAGELKWLWVCNTILITTIVSLAYWIDLRFAEWTLRMSAALAVGAQAVTFALIAPAKQRQSWQRAAFAVFTIGAVFVGWAWLTPGVSGTWLNRAVILMVEMFAMIALLGLELDKGLEREPEWTKAIRDCAPYLTGAGVIALFFVLCTEVFYQIEFGAVRVNVLALATVAVSLASAAVICILFALSPKHDPLALPEHRRRNYVYVAELMLALFFMHIRLTMPWLFTGFFERYWPLVVVAIAYLGVVTSEMLRRRNVLVLAHPIERTGVFLPLLPVMGFWLTAPEIDYSLLLFLVGGLYGLLSILRRSFVFGILAALAGNAGLWYGWHRTLGYGIGEHPQLWLIPAACSVLIAAHLNRKDLSEEQQTGIRYLALVTIYASSTADIFINGVANSPWLPMILAALSLVGVFGGIMLRIRAFLLLGSLFLLLAIATMIYYASANFGWTWLWYVAGIVTGATIIFMFALFEKKRDEMLRVVEGLKSWDR